MPSTLSTFRPPTRCVPTALMRCMSIPGQAKTRRSMKCAPPRATPLRQAPISRSQCRCLWRGD
jgi:hypothetical protein